MAAIKEKKGLHIGASVAAAGVRGSFLALVNGNVFSIATRLKKTKDLAPKDAQVNQAWKNILSKYYNFGGNKNKLISAIETGAKKKPKLVKLQRKGKISFDGIYQDSWSETSEYKAGVGTTRHSLNEADYFYVVGTATVLGIISQALAILIPIIAMLKPVAPKVGALELDGETEAELNSKAATDPKTVEVQKQVNSMTPQEKADLEKKGEENKNADGDIVKILMWVGGIAAALSLGAMIYHAFKNK